MVIKRGLESVIWDNYSEVETILARHGFLPLRQINRFALYQLSAPDYVNGERGTFFAVRESVLERGSVEKAIFWESPSLEDAVVNLSSLPSYPIGKSVKDEVIGIRSISIAACLGITAAFLTRSVEFTLAITAAYLAGRATFSVLRNYSRFDSALEFFKERSEGKDALSKALEFTEIVRY